MRNYRIAIVASLFVLLVAVPPIAAQQPEQPAPGQQPPQEQPPAKPEAPTAQPPAPPVNPEEEQDYEAFRAVPNNDVQQQIELGEEFLAKYANSRYRGVVYARLTAAYMTRSQDGDVDRLFMAGEKALEFNPNNVDVLAMIAYAVPRRLNPQDLDAQQKLEKVERYSQHAIEILNTMGKPEAMTEEDFARAKNEKLSMAHSGLAMVNYHRQNFPGMAEELEQAVQLSASPDPSDLYLLGIAYQQAKRYADAATAYGRCGEMVWAWQDRCQQSQAQAQKLAEGQLTP